MDTLHFLYGLLFLYAIYLWKRPNDWLVILPTFIVLVDFTPWTGRFLFNELDLFLALTIIVSGLSKKLQLPDKRAVLFLVLVVAAFALPTIINVSSLPHDEGYISNPYYSYGYGLKVLKGFIYALCLSLLAYRDFLYSSKQMVARLCYGSWIASAALFFIILWERKTLIAFANFENWWTVASSFLDFT